MRRPKRLNDNPGWRLPAGIGLSDADHELIVSGVNLTRFAELIGFSDFDKQARLAATLSSYKRSLNRERFIAEAASRTR